MTFKKLKEISRPHFYCLSLDKYFPKNLRNILSTSSAFLALVSFVFSFFDSLPLYFGFADGLFFLFMFIFLVLTFLEFFYKSNLGENIDYALSGLLYVTDEIDVTKALFDTKIGTEILMKSGITHEYLKNFVYSEKTLTIASSLNLGNDFVNLTRYVSAVYDADKSLQTFLSQNSINKEKFIKAADWVTAKENQKLNKERFWSRENLGTIPSIGTNWSYGETTDLGKFGIPFENTIDISALFIKDDHRNREVSALEKVLKKRESNVIIIDDNETVAREIVGRFLKRIELGIVPPILEHKNIIELNWKSLIEAYKNKEELKSEILKIFKKAFSAGNVILYIRDLPTLTLKAKIPETNLPIIASATTADFHFFIETNPTFSEKFETIISDSK